MDKIVIKICSGVLKYRIKIYESNEIYIKPLFQHIFEFKGNKGPRQIFHYI